MPVMPPLDHREEPIWMDGTFVPGREARTHVLCHSLSYGSAAFEGVRAYDGRVFLAGRHAERLIRSCRSLGYELPYGAGELARAMQEVVDRGGIGDGYIRPLAWRGAGTAGSSGKGNAPHVAIAAWPWPEYYDAEIRRVGLRLTISRWRRPCPRSAPVNTKAAGLYMVGSLARSEAEAAGFDDALLLDHRGDVGEASGANIFFVRDGEVHTPLSEGILMGVTRQVVTEIARASGLRVVERAIAPGELSNATEAFLTGTAVEIISVRQIDEIEYHGGPVTQLLGDCYQQLVRSKDLRPE